MIVKGPGAFATNFLDFFLNQSPDKAGYLEAGEIISLISIVIYTARRSPGVFGGLA